MRASPEELRDAVHDNLRNLGLDVLDVVNLRARRLRRPRAGLDRRAVRARSREMQQEGLIRHLGISTVSAEQIAEAQSIAPVVCVQNFYNVAHRVDDELVDSLAAQGIAYVPYFPLGGFTPAAVRRRWTRSPPGSTPRRWPSRWPGCCSARRTSCSSRAPHPSPTCARTSPAPGSMLSEEDVAELDGIGLGEG